MSRRPIAAVILSACLFAQAGCLEINGPLLPSLRSWLPGSDCPCPPGVVSDFAGPILDAGEPVGPVPAAGKVPLPDGVMPQPRLAPEPAPAPQAQTAPYTPTKGKK